MATHFVDASPSALRELVVPDVGVVEWQRLLDLVRASTWSTRYWVAGALASLPLRIEDIFLAVSAGSARLQIDPDGLDLDVWFFDESVVHCSVAASAVTSQSGLDRLLSFTRTVGVACEHAVYMTYEGGDDDPLRNAFLTYEPTDDSFQTVEPSELSDGPIFGEATRLILLEDCDTVRVLLSQQAEWQDSAPQLEEIQTRLQSAITYVQSEALDWERTHARTERWRIEIRCVTPPPPKTTEALQRIRDAIREQGGDLVIKLPGASSGLFV